MFSVSCNRSTIFCLYQYHYQWTACNNNVSTAWGRVKFDNLFLVVPQTIKTCWVINKVNANSFSNTSNGYGRRNIISVWKFEALSGSIARANLVASAVANILTASHIDNISNLFIVIVHF